MADASPHRSRAGDRHLVRAHLAGHGPDDLVGIVTATLLTTSRVSAALDDLRSDGQVVEVRDGGVRLWATPTGPRG